MKLKLEIDLDNAAFDLAIEDGGADIALILRDVADRVASDPLLNIGYTARYCTSRTQGATYE